MSNSGQPHAYLVDASMYIFRAWHSMPPEFSDVDGHPVNAVHGYTRFLLLLLERQQPTHIAVAFDTSLTTSFRNELYPAYKANREAPPAELLRQFEYCQAITTALGLPVMSDAKYEADDLIGSAVAALARHDCGAIIVSADKDFGQLVSANVSQWDYARDLRWDAQGVFERMGVHPHQVADYLALTGDSVDNIPGVPGIGAKTAAHLLGHFGSLDSLLERVDEVDFLRLRGAKAAAARLREHAALARLFRSLTTISLDAPIPSELADYRPRSPDMAVMEKLFDRLRLGPHTRSRVRALAEPTDVTASTPPTA